MVHLKEFEIPTCSIIQLSYGGVTSLVYYYSPLLRQGVRYLML